MKKLAAVLSIVIAALILLLAFSEIKSHQSVRAYQLLAAAVSEKNNGGLWIWDFSKEEIFWDEKLLEIFGIDDPNYAPTYDKWLELVHPEDRDRVDTICAQSKFHGGAYRMSYRIKTPGGQLRSIIEVAATDTFHGEMVGLCFLESIESYSEEND
jgi:PAS domain-containing protein